MTQDLIANSLTYWSIENWPCYLSLAVAISIGIRVCTSLLRAVETKWAPFEKGSHLRRYPSRSFWVIWRDTFGGFGPNPDFWFPFWIGTLELVAYPVVMAGDAWPAIAAWITLKSLSPWREWQSNRWAFQRYLVGNALTLVLANALLTPFVTAG